MANEPITDPITWALWMVTQDRKTWEPRLDAAVRGIKDAAGNPVFPGTKPDGLPEGAGVVFSDLEVWIYTK